MRISEYIQNLLTILTPLWPNGPDGPAYLRDTVNQRLKGPGSRLLNTDFQEVMLVLNGDDWWPQDHPAVSNGRAFKTLCKYPSELGVSPIEDGETVVIEEGHGGVAQAFHTGFAQRGEFELWAIVSEADGKDVLATFHPGEPIVSSPVTMESLGLEKGAVISVPGFKAKELGFMYAKSR